MKSPDRLEQILSAHDRKAPLVLFGNTRNPILVPPSIAELLRDKPPESELAYLDESEMFEPLDKGGSSSESDSAGRCSNESEGSEGEDVPFHGVHVHRHGSTGCGAHGLKGWGEALDEEAFIDWDVFWSQFRNVGGKLVPFLKTMGLYFVIFIPEDRPSLVAMGIKCLPVLSLALFVILHGISLEKQHKFARCVLGGLLLSCLGDAFLVWPTYFLHGMAAFGLAQCLYIRAFGFEPLNLKVGAFIFVISSGSLLVIGPGVLSCPLSMSIGVVLYSCLLSTMTWRALSRTHPNKEFWSWTKLCSCLGAISFVISDSVLAVNKFYMEIPHHQTIIMVTYYLAQLGIALSVVKPKDPVEVSSEDQREEKWTLQVKMAPKELKSSIIRRVI